MFLCEYHKNDNREPHTGGKFAFCSSESELVFEAYRQKWFMK